MNDVLNSAARYAFEGFLTASVIAGIWLDVAWIKWVVSIVAVWVFWSECSLDAQLKDLFDEVKDTLDGKG